MQIFNLKFAPVTHKNKTSTKKSISIAIKAPLLTHVPNKKQEKILQSNIYLLACPKNLLHYYTIHLINNLYHEICTSFHSPRNNLEKAAKILFLNCSTKDHSSSSGNYRIKEYHTVKYSQFSSCKEYSCRKSSSQNNQKNIFRLQAQALTIFFE